MHWNASDYWNRRLTVKAEKLKKRVINEPVAHRKKPTTEKASDWGQSANCKDRLMTESKWLIKWLTANVM